MLFPDKVFSLSTHLSCDVIEEKEKVLKPCQFPFEFDGAIYNHCTNVDNPDEPPW